MGPPYDQTTAVLGETPTIAVDVPISSVFILLFIIGAAGHVTRFQLNLRRGHKFLPSAASFAFCITRIVANALRIAWAIYPSDVPISIAAQIFVVAGVVIPLIINLLYAQRILRAAHPNIGWSRPLSRTLWAVYLVITLNLVMIIATTVQSFYTLDTFTRLIDVDLLCYGTSLFAAVASLPLAIITYVLLAPRQKEAQDHFGHGTLRSKCLIVGTAATLISLGAWFRAVVNYQPPRPMNDPAWYHSKSCFYVLTFILEIIVVYGYFFSRADLRLYVPDGSSKRRHYRLPILGADLDNTEGQRHLKDSKSDSPEGSSFQILEPFPLLN
ncbi:hypothetical protein F5B20DRAFT_433930 [Whalleya microplaca]|nr:hypothetical protein F5B20DRAFT_433930 [Whalleya microplaca]